MRDCKFDFVRVVAMFFVVAVHSLMIVDSATRSGSVYEVAGQSVFFTANFLFFFLSGYFSLRKKNGQDAAGFYLKKARNILVPVVVMFALRTLYETRLDAFSLGSFLSSFFENSLSGFSNMEYWFLFALIPPLIATPLLAESFDSVRSGRLLLGIGLLHFTASYVFRNLGISYAWTSFFSCCAVYYCLGPYAVRMANKEDVSLPKAIVGFSIAACLTFLLVYKKGWRLGAYDESPLFLIESMMLFVVLAKIGERIKTDGPVACWIGFVGRHSFSVYLVHMIPLTLLVSSISERVSGIAIIPVHVAVTLAVIVASLLLAICIDAGLVKPIQKGFDMLVAKAACLRRANDGK